MHAPIAMQGPTSARATESGPRRRASSASTTAATASRTTPITSGVIAASRTSRIVAVPVVPHDVAASAIKRRPRSARGLDGPDTARDDSAGLSTLTAHGRRLCPAGRISIMTIAFIGTGTMGRPMLANLVRKGFAVTAYDVVPGALDAAVKAGATAASSSSAAARGADLIVT